MTPRFLVLQDLQANRWRWILTAADRSSPLISRWYDSEDECRQAIYAFRGSILTAPVELGRPPARAGGQPAEPGRSGRR